MSSADELPIGTVTFLFTDIEGSTLLLKQLRDRYADALEGHQQILRKAFVENGGHEIDTQGDSFFVAFRRAKDAVAAAIACQRGLAEHAWPNDTELRVRMGIHTGEPAVGGERYVGLGVHRAARICAAGHGGQVLVSQTTRELLRPALGRERLTVSGDDKAKNGHASTTRAAHDRFYPRSSAWNRSASAATTRSRTTAASSSDRVRSRT